MRFVLTKRIILSISAIMATTSVITGVSLLDVNGQKQLTTLNQFPNYLQDVIEQSLQVDHINDDGKLITDPKHNGKDSYFYHLFLLSLDSNYLTTPDKNGNLQLNNNFKSLLIQFKLYYTNPSVYAKNLQDTFDKLPNHQDAEKIGSLIWEQVKTNLQENHLTFNATNGISYVLSSMSHGQSVMSILHTPKQQINKIDTVLQDLLTETGHSDSFASSHLVNEFGKTMSMPHAPDNITINTPNINGIKIGVIFTIITSPILIILYILLLIGFWINKNYRFTIKNKINSIRQQLKTTSNNKPTNDLT